MNESTIPRIKSHIDSGNGFAIISAHVHEYIKKAIKIVSEGGSSRIVEKIISSGEKNNKNRHNQLKEDVRSLGYGYIEVDGNYTYEAIKIPNVNLIIDNFNVEEESLIVPTGSGILSIEYVMKFREDIISLGKKYNQEAIIIVYPKNIRDEIGGPVVRGIEMKNSSEVNDIDWGSKIVKGKGSFGASSLKKGRHGSKRKEFSTDYADSDLPDYFNPISKKGYKEKNVDIKDIKFPPNPKWKGRERGVEWHTESLSLQIIRKINELNS